MMKGCNIIECISQHLFRQSKYLQNLYLDKYYIFSNTFLFFVWFYALHLQAYNRHFLISASSACISPLF